MLVSYLRKKDMEIYRLSGQEVKKVASGSLDSIKPFTGRGKKVMVVGRDVFLHTRRRYPPTTSENIAKAIKMDIKEIFPLKDPAFSFKIFEKTPAYSFVDIWAWDCSNYKEIRSTFRFTHVLPEDAVFTSEEPEITVFEGKNLQHLIAHCRDGFLGGLSLRHLTNRGFETYLRSLGRYADGIKRVRYYTNGTRLDFTETLPIVHEEYKDIPPCLKYIKKTNLRHFRFTHEIPFNLNFELTVRFLIYCMIAYSFSLFISGRNYEGAINETIVKLNTLTDGLPEVEQLSDNGNYSEGINKLKEKRESITVPLAIMDMLAQSMPEGDYIKRIVLNDKIFELFLSSKAPIDAIRSLSLERCVKSVKLMGSPSKERNSDTYNFRLKLELNPCE